MPKLREKTIFYKNKKNIIPWITRIAIEHRNDWATMLKNPSQVRYPELMSSIGDSVRVGDWPAAVTKVFGYAQLMYLREEGEQLLKPLFFAQVGGDCDDQVIFFISFFAFIDLPPQMINLVEGAFGDSGFTHIFTEIVNGDRGSIFLDPLPDTRFGETAATRIIRHPLIDLMKMGEGLSL